MPYIEFILGYMDYSSDDEDWVKESLRRVSNARRKKKFRSIMKSRSDVESGNEVSCLHREVETTEHVLLRILVFHCEVQKFMLFQEPSDERKSLEDEELFTLQPEHSKVLLMLGSVCFQESPIANTGICFKKNF